MSNLQIFKNEELGEIRTVMIDDKPYFVGKDVAEALGYKNTRDALLKHVDEEDKNTVAIYDGIGNPNKVLINESGLYSLILRSDLPSATKFKRWVTNEVLPSIRKTGSYAITNQREINELKGQITTLVNDMFGDKLEELNEYYKINSQTKAKITSYIKKRLGILRVDGEYEQVKARVFLLLGINKWEDLDLESYKKALPIIDESIRIVKLDRPEQITMFD